MGATDPEVAKRNAQVEERLKNLELPVLRPESKKALEANLERTAGRYDLISQVAQRHGVDPDELYAKYVIETRKSADPENPGTSSAGAQGPFQLMKNTREKYVDPSITDPFERDADAAAKLMADIKKRNDFSNDAVAAAYNYGESNVRQWGGNAASSLPSETTNYLAYARELRPILRERSMQRELKAMPRPAFRPPTERRGYGDYLLGNPSPTDFAIEEYDAKIKAGQDAIRRRYQETP